MLGFTGTYKAVRVLRDGPRYGYPVPCPYLATKEPITDFGVKKIIRVGSRGAVRMDVATCATW